MTEEREMTALMTSVGAEVRQSPDLTPTIIPDYGENFNPTAEEIFLAQQEYEQEMQAQAKAEREAAPDFMQTVSMPELYEMVYPGKPPIIDRFLYPGTYLFVGAPKVGKSFMMAQIAYHVSSGTPMWNYSVRKGTVLYLALEDDYRRLQERLYRMFGTETTPDLFFSVASKSLNEGLLDQLGTFLNEHHETSVVIIDTLQKVREAEGDTYSYARDYDIIAGLKTFADGSNITLNFDKNSTDCINLINKITASITSDNDQIKPPSAVDPLPLAQKVWQDLWAVSGATPENCLYTFVEIFIFKYLSDLGVLQGVHSFYSLLSQYGSNTDDDVLDFYAQTIRVKIKQLFPWNPKDKTTIINGTIFVSKDDKAVSGYATVFRRILNRFNDFGTLENIDYDFKSKLFETFLKESISKKNWGQYFTPLKVVRAIVNMVELSTGIVTM